MSDEYLPTTGPLASSTDMQQAVIGWMLKDHTFALKCKQFLKKELFAEPSAKESFAAMCAFMNQYEGAVPTREALTDYTNSLIAFKIPKDFLGACIAFADKYRFQNITDSMTDWIKTYLFKRAILDGSKALQKNDLNTVSTTMKNLFDEAAKASFDINTIYRMGDPIGDFTKLFNNTQSDITTGIKEFDDLMGGGLARANHTVLLAPLNVGKTTVCINFIAHNIMRKKHVLFLTHEDLDLSIMTKIRCRMLLKSRDEIFQLIKSGDKNFPNLANAVEKEIKKYLVYIGKTRSYMVEDVVDEIRIQTEQLFNATGHHFDLVVDDYPGKLMSNKMSNLRDVRHGIKHCYSQFEQLAQQYQWHAISPVQSNREGYNNNKFRKEGDELLDAGNISESLGVAMDASNVISLNRSDRDARAQRMFFKIVKTRGAAANTVIQTNTDFAKAITHDSRLGWNITKGSLEQIQNRAMTDILSGEENAIEGSTNSNPDIQ